MSTRPAVTDPLWVRLLLTGVALLFLAGFLVVPLAAVFAQAFEKGQKTSSDQLADLLADFAVVIATAESDAQASKAGTARRG